MASAAPTSSPSTSRISHVVLNSISTRWIILLFLICAYAFLGRALVLRYYCLYPSVSIPRVQLLSRNTSHNNLLLAPRVCMTIGISTIIAAVSIAPFSTDVQNGMPCPCNWTEDFRNQYTTLSILAAYAPMKYIILVGFSAVSFLVILTGYIGYFRWWKWSAVGNSNISLLTRIFSVQMRRAVLITWLVMTFTLAFATVGNLVFPHHFDRKVHILMSYLFFASTALSTVFGQTLVFFETKSRQIKNENIASSLVTSSFFAMITTVILSFWYLFVFTRHVGNSEGLLAISEHMLIIAQLCWVGSLSKVFLRDEVVELEECII
mmetsp:Transcript_37614/g.87677  ORF Transcript_37614/g.87677 Transcript_37614/m.87677 type:complete len:321 (-) Transcript_37614:9-971(-)